MSAPNYPNEKSAPPPGYASPPPGAQAPVTPTSPHGHPGDMRQAAHAGMVQPHHPPPPQVHQVQQPYVAPANLQAGAGAPDATHPECRHYGHDTHIGCGGLTFLVCCFPCSLLWLCVRQKSTCRRCGHRVNVSGPID